MIKNILSIIWWFVWNIMMIIAFLAIVSLTISYLEKCDAPKAKAATTEWKCCAKPPKGTKHRDEISFCGISEKKEDATYNAILFCNKFFKTKCEISSCKRVEK